MIPLTGDKGNGCATKAAKQHDINTLAGFPMDLDKYVVEVIPAVRIETSRYRAPGLGLSGNALSTAIETDRADPPLYSPGRVQRAERLQRSEIHFHRDFKRYRLPVLLTRSERPLLYALNGFFVEAQPEAPRQVDVFSFAIDIHCEAQEDRTRILRFSGLFRIHRIELTPDFSGRSAHEIRACRTARKLYTLNFGWLSRRFV